MLRHQSLRASEREAFGWSAERIIQNAGTSPYLPLHPRPNQESQETMTDRGASLSSTSVQRDGLSPKNAPSGHLCKQQSRLMLTLIGEAPSSGHGKR